MIKAKLDTKYTKIYNNIILYIEFKLRDYKVISKYLLGVYFCIFLKCVSMKALRKRVISDY